MSSDKRNRDDYGPGDDKPDQYEKRDKYEPDPGPEPDDDADYKPPCPSCGENPDECDPQSIAVLKCKAEGIAAQAAFIATSQPALLAAQGKYAEAKTAYRDKRSEVALQVQDLRHDIKHLVGHIRCLIKQSQVAKCIDDAHDCVVAELAECLPSTSAYNCEFDACAPDLTLEELVQRIADYTEDLNAAKARFDQLVGEPAALDQRVKDRKVAIDAVKAALAGDPATTDPKRLYATALVEQDRMKKIWAGFKESTQSFIDALCQALLCWTKAADAVSILIRREAELKCHDKAHKEACEKLAKDTVNEILAVYERLCAEEECEEDRDYSNCDKEHNHDGDDSYRE